MALAAPPRTRVRATLAPGLNPAAPYTSRLSARSALFTELRLLLEATDSIKSASAYRRSITDANLLFRANTSSRIKLWKELKTRYLLDSGEPLFEAFWVEWHRCVSEAERGLTAYVLLALNDKLVAELGTEWLFPRLRRAQAEVRPTDVEAFIRGSQASHPETSVWTDKTLAAVAQKYCASIRDFGLARGIQRKTVIRPALYAAPVRLLVVALRMAGVAPLELVQARIFRLLALDAAEVPDALSELNRLGALRFRMQGDVVELALTGDA